ncbi:MAG: SDR family oxidoreductase [Deltaproteobacteria bacterium]|nr:SDR family oxidoreductase [Deltaproteobacteria bacterium]MBW2143533.1 SDR family oxidoreductase [Deltaproteobacteria bacterium]
MSKQKVEQLFDLSGKSIIVTGGAIGIGKAIVSWLTDAGASVMLTDINMDAANQTAEEIRAEGGKVEAIQADAGNTADAKKVVKAALDAFGNIDILVNNAGIYPASPFLSTTEALWDKVMDVNLKGVFFYSQAVAQAMVEAKRGGKIINVCSIDALRPTGMIAHYNASKGGVLMLTKAMALELAPMNILVNAVAPGGIMTPGTSGIRKTITDMTGITSEQIIEDFLKRVPVGRTGGADDIAKVVLFLASGASDYMCGEMVVVDGGHLMA